MFSVSRAARTVEALHCQAARYISPGHRFTHTPKFKAPFLRNSSTLGHKADPYRRGSLQIRMVLTESRDLEIGTKAPDFKVYRGFLLNSTRTIMRFTLQPVRLGISRWNRSTCSRRIRVSNSQIRTSLAFLSTTHLAWIRIFGGWKVPIAE